MTKESFSEVFIREMGYEALPDNYDKVLDFCYKSARYTTLDGVKYINSQQPQKLEKRLYDEVSIIDFAVKHKHYEVVKSMVDKGYKSDLLLNKIPEWEEGTKEEQELALFLDVYL